MRLQVIYIMPHSRHVFFVLWLLPSFCFLVLVFIFCSRVGPSLLVGSVLTLPWWRLRSSMFKRPIGLQLYKSFVKKKTFLIVHFWKIAGLKNWGIKDTDSQGAYCIDDRGLIVAQAGILPENPVVAAKKALSIWQGDDSLYEFTSGQHLLLVQKKEDLALVLVRNQSAWSAAIIIAKKYAFKQHQIQFHRVGNYTLKIVSQF